jgi:hypothetical protein
MTLGFPGSCLGAGRAEPQANGRTHVPCEATVTQWSQADDYYATYLCDCLNTQNRDVSPVYVVMRKILLH